MASRKIWQPCCRVWNRRFRWSKISPNVRAH
jgi:hypothetical protein